VSKQPETLQPKGFGITVVYKGKRLFAGDLVARSEVVFGIVGALGTNVSEVEQKLANALVAVAYHSDTVQVSQLIETAWDSRIIEFSESPTSIDRLMDLGDALRSEVGHGGAAAALAIAEIAARRNAGKQGDDASPERESFATIIRQLKHPEEVRLLRSVYGPRFILIGVWAPVDERRKATKDRLRSRDPGRTEGWYEDNVSRLIQRDEKDAEKTYGQRVRDTFALADAYVSLVPGQDVGNQLNRIVSLLFGDPFVTPSRDEYAMAHAADTSLRSSDAGRQVGAVIVDRDGEIVVTGVNEVPKPGGGQYWAGDNPDLRDFRLEYDVNERQKHELIMDILLKLQKDGSWLSEERQKLDIADLVNSATVDGPLSDTRIADILEFGRVAHAEMAAICTAARRGVAIDGLTMYQTTYPCHECARLIIASGIDRLVYVDPYPKSQVPEMFRLQISDGQVNSADVVVFEPFQGIAPRLYRPVFAMYDRPREELSGEYGQWNPAIAPPRLVADAEAVGAIRNMEDGVIAEMSDVLTAIGLLIEN
jgi:deoxycytidylate deaminase